MLQLKLFRILAILTTGTVYLPLVSGWAPYPFHTPSIYLLLWLILILITHPTIFLSKSLIYIGIAVVLYYIGILTFWSSIIVYDETIKISFILKEFSWVFLSLMMFLYFLKSKDFKGLGYVILTTYLFLVLTSVLSFFGFLIFPEAARISAVSNSGEETKLFSRFGIGTYGFFVAIMSIIPVLIYIIRTEFFNKFIKILAVIFIFLIYIVVFKALNSTLIIIILSFSITYFLPIHNFKRVAILGGIVLVFTIFVANSYVGELFFNLGDQFSNNEIGWKIKDVGETLINQNFNPETSDTYTAYARFSRILISLNSFLSNPIIGGGISAGHAHWFDRFGLFGLLGMLPWILIFMEQFKISKKIFLDDYIYYYYLCITTLITYGLLKGGSEAPQIQFAIFFLAPSGYFAKFVLSRNEADNNFKRRYFKN